MPAYAEDSTPYSGTQIINTGQSFDAYVGKLKAAISSQRMGIVAEACATCGAKSLGINIPGNRVIMVFNPKFAVRMLKASKASGIEAPLRLYVTEEAGGLARLTYRLPSHVFAPYNVPELNEMAKELDQIVKKIVAAAAK